MKIPNYLKLAAILVFAFSATNAFGQYEAQVIKDLRAAVAAANSPARIAAIAAANDRTHAGLERSMTMCVQDMTSVMQASNRVTDRVNRRYKKEIVDTAAPSIFAEIQAVLPLLESAIEPPSRCLAAARANQHDAQIKASIEPLAKAVMTMQTAAATFYSFSSTIRNSDIVLARSKAVLAGKKFDPTPYMATYRTIVDELTKALKYVKKGRYYENRAKAYDALGETAKAAADRAEAAKFPDPAPAATPSKVS